MASSPFLLQEHFFGNHINGDDGIPGGNDSYTPSSTCELCGWAAAFLGMLAFGSFGVPVKSKVAKSLDIDPLVMQSYKTAMCFLTSWLFLLLRGEEFTFTYWGIVSGLFWVPGGVATIYAIKTAGLAVAIGTGSSFIVLVSFSWGIFFFDEHVHSRIQACAAVVCMLCGLAGMAYYSAPTVAHNTHSTGGSSRQLNHNRNGDYYQPVHPEDLDFLPPEEAFSTTNYVAMESSLGTNNGEESTDETTDGATNNTGNDNGDGNHPDESTDDVVMLEGTEDEDDEFNNHSTSVVMCCGRLRVQERILGILAALVFTGLWGGSIMVPMQFAPTDDKGLPFLTSFAIGASVVTLSLWLIRYLYQCHKHAYSFSRAYEALPSFHFRKMWPYGCTCGFLWSIGNFCSILAVENLGEGVGYSTTQASMLVSGVWGIFYFREVEGFDAILKWNLAASVTVIGILLLSFEHHEA